MRAVVAILLLLLLPSPPAAADERLRRDVDEAFALLARDDARSHARARQRLTRAAAAFDDLALPANRSGDAFDEALAAAFLGDANKPWRGRAFERVLALVTLAALDIERGRCDLALPTLRTAALHDARVDPARRSDAVVIHALRVRCLVDDPAPGDELARARADLRDAAALVPHGPSAHRIEAAVTAPGARLVFVGEGPTFARTGPYGSQLAVTPGDEGWAAGVAGIVRIGGDALPGTRGLDRSHAVPVWSSTTQATTVRGRPYQAILDERARQKRDSEQRVRRTLDLVAAHGVPQGPKALLGVGVASAGAAGFLALGAATDARADDRGVPSLPGSVWVAF